MGKSKGRVTTQPDRFTPIGASDVAGYLVQTTDGLPRTGPKSAASAKVYLRQGMAEAVGRGTGSPFVIYEVDLCRLRVVHEELGELNDLETWDGKTD